ncbi:hypothetical protein B7706_00990 [Streptococcus oralis subsp. dentisani]|nr:hypothetical protein B7706_00990 [Streptococcus oralis subsp. dentisani]
MGTLFFWLFILEKGLKDSLKVRVDQLEIIFNEFERIFCLLVLKVKKQELIEIIVFFQVWR